MAPRYMQMLILHLLTILRKKRTTKQTNKQLTDRQTDMPGKKSILIVTGTSDYKNNCLRL